MFSVLPWFDVRVATKQSEQFFFHKLNPQTRPCGNWKAPTMGWTPHVIRNAKQSYWPRGPKKTFTALRNSGRAGTQSVKTSVNMASSCILQIHHWPFMQIARIGGWFFGKTQNYNAGMYLAKLCHRIDLLRFSRKVSDQQREFLVPRINTWLQKRKSFVCRRRKKRRGHQ